MLNRLLKPSLLVILAVSFKTVFSQSECDGNDITPPVIVVAPSIGEGFCSYPQPQAIASDDTDENVKILTQLNVFTPPAACELIQPDLGANLCNYAQGASMMLFSLPMSYRYFTLDSGTWLPNSDGTAQIFASVHSNNFPNGGFVIAANFSNGTTWSQWSSIPGRTYKADCEGVAANHEDWMYYIMSGATLTGYGDFEGSYYTLTHAPNNYTYGYQVGWGANNYSPEYGSGGWFTAEGVLINNGVTISEFQTAGDFMFKHECVEPQTVLQYVYTASDACENSVVGVQSINTCDLQGPLLANMPLAGSVLTPCQLEEWQPEWLLHNCDETVDYATSYAMGNIEGSDDHFVTVTIDAIACGISRSYEFGVIVPVESELPCLETSCIADVNGDQLVTTSDVMEVIGNFLTENEATDLNQDGVVNIPDLIIVISSFGSMCD